MAKARQGRGSAETGAGVGLVDAIRGEFIDIVEWIDDSRDTIVWRFPRHDNEIKMGAKLVVRESQAAVFVNEGQIADVFAPGTYTLETQNMPILSTLKGWKYGFNSPFKAEVYFVTTRQFTDMKWGTQNPVIVRDPEFGMVRLRAFGAYAARVVDPAALLRELAGTDPQFRTEEVSEYLRQLIVGQRRQRARHLGRADARPGRPAGRDRHAGRTVLTRSSRRSASRSRSSSSRTSRCRPRWRRRSTSAARWASWATSTSTPSSRPPTAIGDGRAQPRRRGGEGIGLGLGMALGPADGRGPRPAAVRGGRGPAPGRRRARPAGPPPLPTAAQWFLGVNGEQQGPYDAAALAGRVGAGALTRETLVWKHGMAGWTARGAGAGGRRAARRRPAAAAAAGHEPRRPPPPLQPPARPPTPAVPRQPVATPSVRYRRVSGLRRPWSSRPARRAALPVLRAPAGDQRRPAAGPRARVRRTGDAAGQAALAPAQACGPASARAAARHTESDDLAGTCQFCGTALVADPDATGQVAPEAVVPFGVDRRRRPRPRCASGRRRAGSRPAA